MRKSVARILIVGLLLLLIPFQPVSAASIQQETVKIAKSYIGVPYRYGGTTPKGFDCSGYTRYVFKQLGVNLPRVSADQYHAGTKVSKSNLQPGDLISFHKTTRKSGITHVGIYIGNNQFIHASSKGVKIDSLGSSYWSSKYYGATRVLPKQTKPEPVQLPALKPGEFYDVDQNNPAYQAISTLGSKGIIAGHADGTFGPNDQVTRGQAAAIVNRVLQKDPSTIHVFSDVAESNIFVTDIAAMKELGIIQGYPDGTFRPDAPMTRAEMAAIVQEAFDLQNSMSNVSSTYNDIDPAFWAHDAIATISSIDTTSIFAGDYYYPNELATRAVFSTAIYNTLNITK